MDKTTKAILKFLADEINYTAYEYSKSKKYGWQDRAKDLNVEGFLLGYVLRKSCELAGVKFEHHEAETGDLAYECYSIIYPEGAEAEEVEICQRVKRRGCKAFCPVSWGELVLCDGCKNGCKNSDACHFAPREDKGSQSQVYCPVFGRWIASCDVCRGG